MALVEINRKRYNFVMNELVDPKGRPLRKFQKVGIEYGLVHPRFILGDDKGLGKTVQLLAVQYILDSKEIQIQCGGAAVGTWGKEVKKWFPDWDIGVQVIEGNSSQRQKKWRSKAGIKVTTFLGLTADLKHGWAPEYVPARLADEVHKANNRKTKTFETMCKVKSDIFHAGTGSPIKKGPQNLWALVHLCNPKLFSSYWKWNEAFCEYEDNFWGREYVGPKNQEQMHRLIANYFLCRTKQDPEIKDQMPPKSRYYVEFELPPMLRKIYDGIANDMAADLPSKPIFCRTVLDQRLRCRQLLACPKLLDEQLPIGPGIEAILAEAEDAELDKFVIYSIFPAAFKYLKPYLEGKGYAVETMQGGMNSKDIIRVSQKWFSSAGKRIVLVSVLFAESYDLVQSSYGYFLGCSYDVEENKQAEDRQHRMSSDEPAMYGYARGLNTCDDRVLEILDFKAVNIAHVLQSEAAAKALLTGVGEITL